MPFKNDQQRRACWAQYSRDVDKGIKPRWNCKKWEEETKRCGSKCLDGAKCQRKCIGKKCWQHCSDFC